MKEEEKLYKFCLSYYSVIISEMISRYKDAVVKDDKKGMEKLGDEADFFANSMFAKNRIEILYRSYETYYLLRQNKKETDFSKEEIEKDSNAQVGRILFEETLGVDEIEIVRTNLKKKFGDNLIKLPKIEHSRRLNDSNDEK